MCGREREREREQGYDEIESINSLPECPYFISNSSIAAPIMY